MLITVPMVAHAKIVPVLSVPVFLEPNRLQGNALVKINGAKTSVEVASFLPILQKTVTQTLFEAVRDIPSVDGFIPLEKLKTTGLDIQFDTAQVALVLTVSQTAEATNTLSLRNDPAQNYHIDAIPATQNTIVNMRGRVLYAPEDLDPNTQGWLPSTLNLDGAQRFSALGGMVLEGEGFYQDRREQAWQRGAVRLVHDDTDAAVRYTAGDILPNTTARQGTGNFGGFGVARNFGGLQPDRLIRPAGTQEFFLDRPAEVEFFVNNVRTQQLSLNAGRYALTDFLFFSGVSDIRLEITDAAGNRRTIAFDAFSAPELLKKNLIDYGLFGGFLAQESQGGMTYQSDDYVSTSFARYGFSDTFTGGVNLQTRQNSQRTLSGIEAVYGTRYGTVNGQLNMSQNDLNGRGRAVELGYTWELIYPDNTADGFDAKTIFTSRDFADVFSDAPTNTTAYEYSARWRHDFLDDRSMSLGGDYAVGRDDNADRWSAELTHTKRLTVEYTPFTVQTNFSAGNAQTDNQLNLAVFLSLSVNFGSYAQAQTSYNTKRDRFATSYGDQTGFGVDTFRWRGDASRDESNTLGGGNVRYAGNRVDVGLDHQVSLIDNNGRKRTQRTTLDFDTALLQADGHVAWGRRVSDSFALIEPHETLENTKIRVNANDTGSRAMSDGFGDIVYSEMTSYRPIPVVLDVQNLPLGYALPQSAFTVKPAYRSGYVLPIGNAANRTIMGQFLQPNGEPLAYTSGQAVLEENPQQVLRFFTNKKGRFVLSGAETGRYTIIMNTDPTLQTTLDIKPATTQLYVPVGEIKLQEGKLP